MIQVGYTDHNDVIYEYDGDTNKSNNWSRSKISQVTDCNMQQPSRKPKQFQRLAEQL